MSEKSLEIFKLYSELSKLLGGDEEAIADLKRLYEHHPEMFKDIKEVSKIIKEVVKEPDLIMKNPKAKNDRDIIAAKKLDKKTMGDIGIRNDEGTNIIFHANKKGERDFRRLERVKKKIEAGGGDALSLHTPSQAWMGANVVSSTLSSASKHSITENSKQSQAKSKEQELDEFRTKVKEASKKIKDDEKTRTLSKDIEK